MQEIEINKVVSELCRRNFFYFVKEFWHEIISDTPVWNWHIEYLCKEFQTATSTVIKDENKLHDLIVNICPATTKSTITSIMLPVWMWLNKPDCVTLCNTISSTNAMKFAQKRRDILISDKFKTLFPDIELRQDATALRTLKNTKGGEITQYTTKGRITGDHGHVRIDDDPMAYTDAISDTESKRCIEGYKAYSSRNKSIDKTVYILVMQRLSQRDTTAHAIKTLKNFKHIVLPATENEQIKPAELKDQYQDGYLDPIRLGADQLDSIKKGLSGDEDDPMSDAEFDSQYLQDVSTKSGLMYTRLTFAKIDRNLLTDSNCFVAVDPAEEGTDTLGAVYGWLIDGKVYITDVIYNSNDSDYNLPKIKANFERFRPLRHYVEGNGMGNTFAKRMQDHQIIGVQSFLNNDNKLSRIDAFKWLVEDYFIFDSENTESEYQNFVKHLKTLPKDGDKKKVGAADVVTHLAKNLYRVGYIR